MRASTFRHLLNLWPPYFLNSMRVRQISPNWEHAQVALYLRPWNRNIMRTQFGGHPFAMIDPIPMLLAMQQLGPRYHVWDKAAEIEFINPGRRHVYAEIQVSAAVIAEIKAAAANGEKTLHWFDISIQQADGQLVARVRKQLYVRLKAEYRMSQASLNPIAEPEAASHAKTSAQP